MSVNLKEVTPEKIGIRSAYVQAFLDELETKQISMHSFLLMRNGMIGAEGYWKPWIRNQPHRMYSATKSFVSAAIGLLAAEGKIGLDDRIVDYFPEFLPEEGVHPYLKQQTVRNMLMMATCYRHPTYDFQTKKWVASYFRAAADHAPGLVFHYDSCGTYVLGALVRRVTGQTFLEYLMERVLLKIGFSPDTR